ncbi:RadC family protein [Vibrio ulleungensis]|uniref:DNA repair protein RadC n=1 Tax=Vibrio ulleungensis TaxID=2807619 RepID=A0ABS2HLC6_9VIBR|nr:DNA repair protein RadC [Vibrio ulleungensis]MBM7038290.1 DNA repair protein RadC [Vibrio ulleungensis]
MSLKALPNTLKPREKLLSKGAHNLSDSELLALLLGTGTRGVDVLQLAQQIIEQHGSLRNLLSAPKAQFCQTKGLGEATYAQLHAVAELMRRQLSETLTRGDALCSPEQSKLFLMSILRGREREAFYVLYLDNQNRMISYEMLFEGTLDSASVYPREVVSRALECSAASILVAHNHPSGLAEPSQADRRITERLINALRLVDIRLLDHFVIGDGEVVSFAERGWV